MTGKEFTGKPNAFENASSYPPVPAGLEPKQPEWLKDRIHKANFGTEFKAEPKDFRTAWDEIELGLSLGRKTHDMMEDLKDQAEAYLQNFLEMTHLTPEEFHERFVVIQSPSEILNLDDITSNIFRATLTITIKPRKEYWENV